MNRLYILSKAPVPSNKGCVNDGRCGERLGGRFVSGALMVQFGRQACLFRREEVENMIAAPTDRVSFDLRERRAGGEMGGIRCTPASPGSGPESEELQGEWK